MSECDAQRRKTRCCVRALCGVSEAGTVAAVPVASQLRPVTSLAARFAPEVCCYRTWRAALSAMRSGVRQEASTVIL
jgi:hypothetical protein